MDGVLSTQSGQTSITDTVASVMLNESIGCMRVE